MTTARDFAGRVAVVTGAAGDIGGRVSDLLGEAGASLALVDIASPGLEVVAARLRHGGVPVAWWCCDVTDDEAVASTIDSVVSHYGRLDLLFNNAGVQGTFAPVGRQPSADFRRVIDVNVIGAFHVLQAAAPHLSAVGGAIVNTASHAGVVGPPNMIAYAASKFAVVGLTQSAARDLAPAGVRVNAISPALIGPGVMWDRRSSTRRRRAAGTSTPIPGAWPPRYLVRPAGAARRTGRGGSSGAVPPQRRRVLHHRREPHRLRRRMSYGCWCSCTTPSRCTWTTTERRPGSYVPHLE